MSGPASISELAPGVQDSMLNTYTPTVPGIENGSIVVDGSASGAAVSNIPFDANAGELAFDMENRSWVGKITALLVPWTAPSGSIITDSGIGGVDPVGIAPQVTMAYMAMNHIGVE